MLVNLIINSIHYGKEGGSTRIKFCDMMDKILVEVEDTGKGMTEEELRTVWDKYYRLAQDKRRVVGSGLGLSIVKSILELHKATFGVESEKHVGSVFWFELPVSK